MEAAFRPPENSFTEFGSVILALIGRNVHFVSELDDAISDSENAGTFLADILRQVYIKGSSAEGVGLPKQNKLALDDALQTARALSGAISISADTFIAHQQLARHVCQVLLLQADCGQCGMPTAILAVTLKLLLTKAKQQNPADAAANCQDILSEQADLFIAAFKRVSAGKALTQCAIHKSKECCQSAQAELTHAFSLLASYSYSTQHRLWDQGKQITSQRPHAAAVKCPTSSNLVRLASTGLLLRASAQVFNQLYGFEVFDSRCCSLVCRSPALSDQQSQKPKPALQNSCCALGVTDLVGPDWSASHRGSSSLQSLHICDSLRC